MLYSYKEILEKYKSDYNIKKAIANKKIFKSKSGLYSDKPNIHYLSILKKEQPQAVIRGRSAYGFTDVILQEITICTTRNATPIRNSEIKQIRMKEDLYKLGITELQY